jgi:CBS domain-containing protein
MLKLSEIAVWQRMHRRSPPNTTPGAGMNVKIADLMSSKVLSAQPHQSVVHVRKMMQDNKVHALPVVASDGELEGIISSHDLMDPLKDHSPVSSIMERNVYTIPQYNDVHHAARLMRNHHIHHVVVTHEQKVVGILSAFDLLALVEDHRFVMKSAPQTARQAPKRK